MGLRRGQALPGNILQPEDQDQSSLTAYEQCSNSSTGDFVGHVEKPAANVSEENYRGLTRLLSGTSQQSTESAVTKVREKSCVTLVSRKCRYNLGQDH